MYVPSVGVLPRRLPLLTPPIVNDVVENMFDLQFTERHHFFVAI